MEVADPIERRRMLAELSVSNLIDALEAVWMSYLAVIYADDVDGRDRREFQHRIYITDLLFALGESQARALERDSDIRAALRRRQP